MISNIWFKIIAGKINKIPEFYTIFARKIPVYIMRQRDGGQAEAKTSSPRPGRGKASRPRPKFWPRGHFGLEELTWLLLTLTDSRPQSSLTVSLIDSYHWLPLRQHFSYKSVMLIHRCLSGHVPSLRSPLCHYAHVCANAHTNFHRVNNKASGNGDARGSAPAAESVTTDSDTKYGRHA